MVKREGKVGGGEGGPTKNAEPSEIKSEFLKVTKKRKKKWGERTINSKLSKRNDSRGLLWGKKNKPSPIHQGIKKRV